MIYINRFFGRSIQFSNGLTIGFNWMHGNGESSRTIATLASYHPPASSGPPFLRCWLPTLLEIEDERHLPSSL